MMIDIAVNGVDKPVCMKEISERQNISVKYLEQIISVLNKAGYVRSIRGPQGGYQIAKQASDYTVGMILRLTEGSLAPVACLDYEENDCPRQDTCATLELWKRLDQAIQGVVDTVTLADLVEWQAGREEQDVI